MPMSLCECMSSVFVCVCGYIYIICVGSEYMFTFSVRSYIVVTTIVIIFICFNAYSLPHPPLCLYYGLLPMYNKHLKFLFLSWCVCVLLLSVRKTVIKGAIKSHHKMENWLQIKQQSIFLPLQCLYQSCKLFRKFIINYFGLTSLCVSHDM